MSVTQNDAGGATGHQHEEGHASAMFYVWIGVILAVVTAVEVGIFYMEALSSIEVPLLILLSASKIVLVVMFFMHLKMEPRFITGLFMSGALLGTFMVAALVILYHFLRPLQVISPFAGG
ncbi:MAG: cytochrome C oxidase subunit IV family protein [Gemmatimonadota bacterium]